MDRRVVSVAILAACCFGGAALRGAHAEPEGGIREFPTTLLVDDPAVGDELTLPQLVVQRQGADGALGPGWGYNLGLELEKRITDRFSIGLGAPYTIQTTRADKTRTG